MAGPEGLILHSYWPIAESRNDRAPHVGNRLEFHLSETLLKRKKRVFVCMETQGITAHDFWRFCTK